ncbi:MAG TPA: 3-hydroxyacyl-CoA dehydrogenase NAD-binding domain-containing protein [Burkholderiaceae bacterium]|nr:3-hydroxyacyl-CoA dehydrogenase NAD-binding domain-containing protein [Burkholderiaceae bacterium]
MTSKSVYVLQLNHPPVNGLSHALRQHIVTALDAAEADDAVAAIVVAGNAKAFCAGADVNELGTPAQLAAPILPAVLERVERCKKPVVAAIAGVALGGGLELAMTCHARVALASAKCGLPEILLGLIPGSGGTQRLPRLVGMELALSMMQTGTPKTAKELANTGMFSQVVDQEVDLLDAATQVALSLVGANATLPLARLNALESAAGMAVLNAAREKLNARQKMQPAYTALLDALAAGLTSFDVGLKRERELFLDLVKSTPALALRHQFKAEREAAKMPAALQCAPRVHQTIAVIGAGTMGAGIAICALDAGLNVQLLEQDDAALARGRERVQTHYQRLVDSKKLAEPIAQERQSRLTMSIDWKILSSADVVIEAVFEDMAVKQDVFKKIDANAHAGAVLASNTSYLDLDAIAQFTQRPQDVVGLHFFSPANVMKLLEVVRGKDSAPDALATGLALGQKLKKMPVLCGNAFGFIGNRIYNAYRNQCEFMLENGAWPEDVDNALTAMGFAMGPFAVADLSGLDIAWRMRQSQAATRDARVRYVGILDHLCELGRLGRKTGSGYYAYVDGKQTRTTDDVVRQTITKASELRGIERRSLSVEEIQRRALMAMVNEAALLLQEGVAQRASDIDVVLAQGYGFPRWEGGPVFWARQQDPAVLKSEQDQLAKSVGFGFVRADLSTLLTK